MSRDYCFEVGLPMCHNCSAWDYDNYIKDCEINVVISNLENENDESILKHLVEEMKDDIYDMQGDYMPYILKALEICGKSNIIEKINKYKSFI